MPRKSILKNGMHNDNLFLIAVMLRDFVTSSSMFMWIEDTLVREALTSLLEQKRVKHQKTHTTVGPEARPMTALVQVAEATQAPETVTMKDAAPNTTKISRKALHAQMSSTTGAAKTDSPKTPIYPPNSKSPPPITKKTQMPLALR